MGDKTGIEWTDATWNPLRGCSRVSEGCRNCYAERVAARFGGPGQPYEGTIKYRSPLVSGLDYAKPGQPPRVPPSLGGTWNGTVKLVEEHLTDPLKWKKPRKIFVNSMSDLFHENVKDEWIDRIFAVMALCPQHTFQVLTKRPLRMQEYFKTRTWVRCCAPGQPEEMLPYSRAGIVAQRMRGIEWKDKADLVHNLDRSHQVEHFGEWPLPNVWLGVSVEDQKAADARVPLLLQTPAAVRFLSCEPLLGPLELDSYLKICKHWEGASSLKGPPWHPPYPKHWYERQALVAAGWKLPLHWVICGGESGPGARPMHPDWARSLRDQCQAAGVPFFFKQWGEWAESESGTHWFESREDGEFFKLGRDYLAMNEGASMRRVGKKAAGRVLDGRTWEEFPKVTAEAKR